MGKLKAHLVTAAIAVAAVAAVRKFWPTNPLGV